MSRFENDKPPVKEGDQFDVTIESVGEKGDGVAKKDGFVLFIPGTRSGERIKVKVTKVLKSVGFAEKVGEATTTQTPKRERREREKPKDPHENFDPEEELDSEDF